MQSAKNSEELEAYLQTIISRNNAVPSTKKS